MIFGIGMTCEIMISNGTFTVGYVNGKPAEWVGNNELTDGADFRLITDKGSTIIFSKHKFRHSGNDDPEYYLHNVVLQDVRKLFITEVAILTTL